MLGQTSLLKYLPTVCIITIMNITKYIHSCVVLEKNNQSIIIDPGIWNDDLKIPENTAGVIVTHEHPDHFDLEKLRIICDLNHEIYIYSHVDLIGQLSGLPSKVVTSGDELEIGGFFVKFFGDTHAIIHPDYPAVANLGIIVDQESFCYPGDSFSHPNRQIDVLALPIAAPWLKIAEAMDYLVAVGPKRVMPTHDAILSQRGKDVSNAWIRKVCDANNIEFMVSGD